MAEPFTLEDMGYGTPAPQQEPMSLEDMGYDVTVPSTGQKLVTPESMGMTPEEAQAARDFINNQPDPRSWGQIASDTLQNVKDVVSYVAPTALGGEGKFIIRDVPGMIYEGVKGGVQAPAKLATGEIPMTDAAGNYRPEAIAEAMKFSSVVMPGKTGAPLSVLRHDMPMAERSARRQIARAIDTDQTQGKIRGTAPSGNRYGPRVLPGATPDQLQALDAAGIPVTGYDLSGGPNMKRLVEHSSEQAHDTAHVVGLQQDIANRAANGSQYVANTIDDIAGRPIVTGDEFSAAVDNISNVNDPNYSRVMSLPSHQQIFSPALKTILEQRPVFRDILRKRAESMRNAGQQPPPFYGPRGNLDIRPTNAPSLEYLDTVYRAVRDRAEKAYDDGDTTVGKDLRKAANDLRAELDNLAEKDANGNSTYGVIRDEASEAFGAKNALEAGYKYIGRADPMKLDEINRNMARYSPTQLAQFRTGLLSRLKDDALKPNGLSKVTSYFDGSNPAMGDKITRILGSQDAMRLGNQLRLQKIVNETKAPVLSPEAAGKAGRGVSPGAAAIIGTSAYVAADQLASNVPTVMNIMSGPVPTAMAVGAGAAGVGYTLKKIISSARNAYEARVAQSVLDAVTTRDPAAIAALERMPPQTVKYVLDRATQAMPNVAAGAAGKAGEAKGEDVKIMPREGRKSGGRVKTNPISAEVKRVRALLSHKTASILSMPDDAVATALHLAKGQK